MVDANQVEPHATGMTIHTGTNDAEAGHLQDVPVQGFTWTWYYGPFGMTIPRTSTHLLVSPEEAESRLLKRQHTHFVTRPDNPVIKIDDNYLPTTGEGEDRMSIDLVKWQDIPQLRNRTGQSVWDIWAGIKIPLDQKGNGGNNLMFVSLFDGHGKSPAVADLAKRTFNACLAWTLAGVARPDGGAMSEDIVKAIALA